MNGGAHHAAIAADEQVARKLSVHGTPSFFINGYALSGAQPLERFERLVRLALTPKSILGDKSPHSASSVATQQ
jgi:protein-disulfide isomerase